MALSTSTTPVFAVENYQQQSPLFGVLPGEIRNAIFTLALAPYEDMTKPYPEDAFWYRPGFRAPRKVSTDLLRTCKLAYAEGQEVFLRNLECEFWCVTDRGPPGNISVEETLQRLGSNPHRIQNYRLFTQMFWLQGYQFGQLCNSEPFRARTLTITIRYSDWYWWEDNEPLRMSEAWLYNFTGPSSMRELRVEYETLSSKRAKMMRIVERNKKWKLATDGDAGHLSAEDTELKEWKWTGTSKLDGKTWEHHGPGDTVEYVVVVDHWKYVVGPMSDEDKSRRLEMQKLGLLDDEDASEHEGDTDDSSGSDDGDATGEEGDSGDEDGAVGESSP